MTTISLPSELFHDALDALSEALADCEADNCERAFQHLRRAQALLTTEMQPELRRASG